MVASRKEEIGLFRGSSVFQLRFREFVADVIYKGMDQAPFWKVIFGFSTAGVENFLLRKDREMLRRKWNQEGGDGIVVVTYSDPDAAWLVFQAALQLVVAVRGLANHVREQRSLPIIATAALYVHLFLEALLVIGCLFILFVVMPAEDDLKWVRGRWAEEFGSMLTGRLTPLLISFFKDVKSTAQHQYFRNEILPLLHGTLVRIANDGFSCWANLHTPVSSVYLLKFLVVGVVLFVGLRGVIAHVGVHIFVTSPTVVLIEDRVQPTFLTIQMAVKTAAVLLPYIIAAQSWIEFRMVLAMVFRLHLGYMFSYLFLLGIYVAILAISGLIVIAHLSPDVSLPDEGYSEELQTYPLELQCCSNVDRKKHKRASSALVTRQMPPNYGGCWQPGVPVATEA